MNDVIAARIGRRVTAIGITAGLIMAYVIMASLSSDGTLLSYFSWFPGFLKDLWLNLLVTVIALFFFGYHFGKKAGSDIIIKRRNYFWVFFRTGVLILWLSTFIGSLVGFFQEGLTNEFGLFDAVVDYLCKPLYWVTFFGVPFLIVVSPVFGWWIKRVGVNISK